LILLDSFIGLFTIFISPQIFLYYKYNNLKYSLILVYGLIISFSASWAIFLIIFNFKLETIYLYILVLSVFIYSLFYMLNAKNIRSNNNYLTWVIVMTAMLPLLSRVGYGFRSWDAVVSWNRWAVELFNNEYNPFGTAYPILLPSQWSLIYKLQGTSEIWWTAQLSLFVIPLITLALLITLYKESKNKAYIFMAIFFYPYLVWINTIYGYMDMPVMLIGLLSILMLYNIEINTDGYDIEYYAYASLLLAGIATIIKQAGFVFLIFAIIYILLNRKLFRNKKRLIIAILISILYFSTYLFIYFQYHDNIMGNLEHLEKISAFKSFGNDFHQNITYIWKTFFSYPSGVSSITPFFVFIGLLLFVVKELRKYNSIGLLSGVFFIIGTLLWIKFFSYDARNSYWVKSFFLIFFSINVHYIFTKYIEKFTPTFNINFGLFKIKKYSSSSIFVIIITFIILLFVLGDDYAYKKQKQFQSKIGNALLAKKLAGFLTNKDICTEIYTNDQPIKYNYHIRKFFDRVFVGGWYVPSYMKFIEHKCKDGRYFMFGKWTVTSKNTGWEKILKLEKDGVIFSVADKSDRIYFIPPNIIIKDLIYE